MSATDQFQLRAHSEQVADELIDAFAGSGRAELMTEYAGQVPLRVVARICGLEPSETADLERDMNVSLDDGEGAVTAYATSPRSSPSVSPPAR